MLNRDWSSHAYEVSYSAVKEAVLTEAGTHEADKDNNPVYKFTPISEAYAAKEGDDVVKVNTIITDRTEMKTGTSIKIYEELERFHILTSDIEQPLREGYSKQGKTPQIIEAEITELKDGQVEITASWFSILNSFFIIALASSVSKIWDSKFNPPAAVKYGLGLIIMSIGFGLLAYGSYGIQKELKYL